MPDLGKQILSREERRVRKGAEGESSAGPEVQGGNLHQVLTVLELLYGLGISVDHIGDLHMLHGVALLSLSSARGGGSSEQAMRRVLLEVGNAKQGARGLYREGCLCKLEDVL